MGDPFIGQISMIAFSYAPRNWAFCSGQLINISENQTLYALLGTQFGGDGRQTFGIPDLRGRVPIGSSDMGTGPGLSFIPRGHMGGQEAVRLVESQMPEHTHLASTNAELTDIAAHQPAYNNDGESINPGTNMVPAIGNSGSGMSATQVKNYSSNTPDTFLKDIEISADVSVAVSNNIAGGKDYHQNMQPFSAINFVIALDGTFPPRN